MRQMDISDLQTQFNAQLASFQSNVPVSRWFLAFSGGLDSRVLLDLLVHSDSKQPIHVVHVHHGLSPNADDWQLFCQACCDEYAKSIEFSARQVDVSSGSVEEAARNARYQVFESLISSGDVILMGHHLNDQAETLLQRVFRGAGITGLQGIPVSRALGEGQLFRPLLSMPRSILLEYAEVKQLSWVEDESNQSQLFDRNFLRHSIIKPVLSRWPKALQGLQRSVFNLQQDAASLEYYRSGWLSRSESSETLSISPLLELPTHEQVGMLSYWIKQHSPYSITRAQLEVLLKEVVLAQADAQALLRVGELEFRRFNDRLYCMSVIEHRLDQNWSHSFTLSIEAYSISLPDGSIIKFEPVKGGLQFPSNEMTLQFRQGGECIKPIGDSHTRELKKWFQAESIPPWLRSRIPLLYCNHDLVAVADLCFDQCCFSDNEQLGWHISWQRSW